MPASTGRRRSAASRRTGSCSACAAISSPATRTATPACATSASTASAPRGSFGSSFAREPGFDIAAHAARAFGSYQDEARHGEVVWRFAPTAAPTARVFVIHPGQRLEEAADGSLVVRFEASGWLEMAWHLYQWGDAVEVLAPEGLRALVEGHRRGDFEALP